MNDAALQYVQKKDGWALGTGASIVIVDKGAVGGLSTPTARDDISAFIFSQEGLMAGLGIQGSKVTKINTWEGFDGIAAGCLFSSASDRLLSWVAPALRWLGSSD